MPTFSTQTYFSWMNFIGRQVARQRGLRVVVILGKLLAAKERGMPLPTHPVLDQLINDVGFRISDALYREVLDLAGE